MHKTLQIKQYNKRILSYISTSQFLQTGLYQRSRFKKKKLIIQNKRTKKTHFLYLFLTTKKKPFAKKQYLSTKNLSQKTRPIKAKSKAVFWQTDIKKKSQIFNSICLLLFQIIPFQSTSEKKILKLNNIALDLITPYAPLTTRTQKLKSKNSYLSDIPLSWSFFFTSCSLFQKMFSFRFMKFINANITYRRLENVIN